MRYENDGSGVRELRSRIRVQTNAALTPAGQLVFQYNALDEEMIVKGVQVLKKAEEWSLRSIESVEKELNIATVSNVQSATLGLVNRLSAYWDPMDWVKFQEGKLDDAAKYILAAWQINDAVTISFHLGRIYQAQDHKKEAAEMYLTAQRAAPR